MSRRKSRPNLAVSLFPFLAVLVCAMGALIFLLIVTSQMIGDETPEPIPVVAVVPEPAPAPLDPAVDVTGYEPPPLDDLAQAPEYFVVRSKIEEPPEIVQAPIPPRRDPNPELERTKNRLQRERARQRRELKEREAELQTAKQKLVAASQELAQHQQDLGKLQTSHRRAAEQDEAFQAEHEKLQLQIKGAKKRIAKLRQQQPTAPSKFALVPYDGQRGTTRRPIFIECTEKGITIWPEGVFLGPNKLEGFTETLNPLLAGTRALMEYWKNRPQRADDNSPGEPYVLLVVRPKGSIAYYLSKKFLTELGQPHGYELVEDDFSWHLPQPDPKAKRVLETAIAATLRNRAGIVSTYSMGGGDNLSKFPDLDEQRAEDDLPFTSNTSNSSRFARKRELYRRKLKKQRGNAEAFGTPSQQGITGRPRGQEGQMTGAPQSLQNGRGLQRHGDGRYGSRSQESGQMLGRGQNRRDQGNSREQARTNFGTRERGGNFEDDPGERPRKFPGSLSAEENHLGRNRGESSNQGESTRQNGINEEDRPPALLSADQLRGGDSEEWKPSETGTGVKRFSETGEESNGEESNGEESNGEESNGGESNGGGQRFGNQSQSKTAASGSQSPRGRQGSPRTGAQSPSETESRSTGTSSSFPAGQPNQPQLPPLILNRLSKTPQRRDSLAKRGWGISRRQSGIGIEQKVVVEVFSDRIKVSGRKTSIALGHGETKNQLLRAVVVDIDEQAKNWGEPPTGFYWVPSIRFRVHPRGARVYQAIERPLREGGLSTAVEYLRGEPTASTSQEVPR